MSHEVQHALVDKTWHFLSFMVLTLLGLLTWQRQHWLFVVLIALGLGAAIEFLQATPWVGRDADLQDFLADTAGICLAVLLWAWLQTVRR